MRLIRALRDCKQRSLTVSKKAPTVSKKSFPRKNQPNLGMMTWGRCWIVASIESAKGRTKPCLDPSDLRVPDILQEVWNKAYLLTRGSVYSNFWVMIGVCGIVTILADQLYSGLSGLQARVCPRKRVCPRECPTRCPRHSCWDTFWTQSPRGRHVGHSLGHPVFRVALGRGPRAQGMDALLIRVGTHDDVTKCWSCCVVGAEGVVWRNPSLGIA